MMNKLLALSLASFVFAACADSGSDVSLRLWPNSPDEVHVTMSGDAAEIPALRTALEQELGSMRRGSLPVAFSDGEPLSIRLPPRTNDVLASVLPAIEHAADGAGFTITADAPVSDVDPGVVHQGLRNSLETFCEALTGAMRSCQFACSASLNRDLADLYNRVCDDYHSGPHYHF